MDALGLYLSIPFCRAKCSFCNFASDAFAPGRLPGYVDAICSEIATTHSRARALGASLPASVDSIYFGGGTPSLLGPAEIRRIFAALRDVFSLEPDAEITVECAPKQLGGETLEELQRQGVNRLSFGIQSFADRESAAVGRLHTAVECVAELERVRAAGLLNVSLDLIAGLPHQTESSWRMSLDQAIACAVPHVSVYLLEIDEESRLGREILAEGGRYGASSVPTDDQVADSYELACERLKAGGIEQYEISNFTRPGFESAHNLKYWRREPYLGFGLEAHSMLRTNRGDVRFANTDDLDTYLAEDASSRPRRPVAFPVFAPSGSLLADGAEHQAPVYLNAEAAFEEALFLGLRLNEGVSIPALRASFGARSMELLSPILAEAEADGLLEPVSERIRLTARGRVLSNELFSRLLTLTPA